MARTPKQPKKKQIPDSSIAIAALRCELKESSVMLKMIAIFLAKPDQKSAIIDQLQNNNAALKASERFK